MLGSRLKQYKAIEKSLQDKFAHKRENEVIMDYADFDDGKLTVNGYNKLKEQCAYIDYDNDIEIKVPKRYSEDFHESLEKMAVVELSRLKKDRRYLLLQSVFLLALALACFLLLRPMGDIIILTDLITIASWVFVWAAVEKWFFERVTLREKRFNLLQILSARVTAFRGNAEDLN